MASTAAPGFFEEVKLGKYIFMVRNLLLLITNYSNKPETSLYNSLKQF